MADDEEYIDNDNWVDLDVGDTGTMFAALDAVFYGDRGGSEPGFMVTFADWSQFSLRCDRPRALKPFPIRTHLMIRVRRTEDGLDAIAAWTPGGVPVPLSNA